MTEAALVENMTRDETAIFLRCGLTKLWELEREGRLRPSFRLGRRVLYRKADVERFCARLARRAK